MNRLCVFLLLLPAAFGAQRQAQRPGVRKPAPAAQQATRWPIQTLAVEGNHLYTSEQILALAGLKVGQTAGKDDFEAARERLVAAGAFETVGYRFEASKDAKGYAASFQVTEVNPAFAWRLEDLGVPDQDLKTWLTQHDPLLAPRIPGTQQVLDRVSRVIEQYLSAHGKPEKVLGKIVPGAAADELVVVFRPAKGLPSVARVVFDGNTVVPATALQNAIADVAVGTPYQEDRFRQLLDTSVRPLYDARGRIRVAFPKVTTEPARDVNGVVVKVTVNEGQTYELGDVKVAGAAALPSASLLKAGNIKTGDVANFDDIAAGAERMKDALRRIGYMRVTDTLERTVNDAKRTVDVVVRLDQGPQFKFGKLTMVGVDLNTAAGLRKLWALKEGQPFRGEYPDYYLSQLQQGGYLENLHKTRSKVDIDEPTHTVDVTLYFQ